MRRARFFRRLPQSHSGEAECMEIHMEIRRNRDGGLREDICAVWYDKERGGGEKDDDGEDGELEVPSKNKNPTLRMWGNT